MAVQVTRLVPIGNVEADGGWQVTLTAEQPDAGGVANDTTAPAGEFALDTASGGQVMIGGTSAMLICKLSIAKRL